MTIKKLLVSMLAVFMVFVFVGFASADSNVITMDKGPEYTVGLDFPSFGWANYDENDQLIGYRGFNLGLGYSQKTYFSPAEYDNFNPYWGWGTVIALWPYVNVGADYIIPVGDDDSGQYFSFGGTVGMVIPFPYASIGLSFAW